MANGLAWAGGLGKVLWASRTCPLCSSMHFEQAEARSLDRVLRVLSLRPVRCVNCFRRYYWFAR